MSQQKGETEPELSITSAEGVATEPEFGITSAETVTTEPEQNTTKPKAKGGRPRKAPDTGLWAIRGVDMKPRAIVEKTTQHAGKIIGQFERGHALVLPGPVPGPGPTQSQLPASPRNLQVEQLTQMVEGIAARLAEPARKSLWQRVFGQ